MPKDRRVVTAPHRCHSCEQGMLIRAQREGRDINEKLWVPRNWFTYVHGIALQIHSKQPTTHNIHSAIGSLSRSLCFFFSLQSSVCKHSTVLYTSVMFQPSVSFSASLQSLHPLFPCFDIPICVLSSPPCTHFCSPIVLYIDTTVGNLKIHLPGLESQSVDLAVMIFNLEGPGLISVCTSHSVCHCLHQPPPSLRLHIAVSQCLLLPLTALTVSCCLSLCVSAPTSCVCEGLLPCPTWKMNEIT